MCRECLAIPKDEEIRSCVWRIKSSDAKLFTINNIRYDKFLMFVGEKKIHWIYYNEPTFKSAEGITPLTISYCSCCFHDQYLKFIDSIHENLESTGYLVS